MGSLNKTNTTSSYLLTNNLSFGIRKKWIELNSFNSWLYGEQQKKLTNNDVNSTLTCNLYRKQRGLYYWGLGNYTQSYSLKINDQYQGGVGAAYSIIDNKKSYLNFSDGILYEYSDIFVSDTIRDVYNTFRNSFRISLKFLIADIVSIKGVGFYQNSLSNSNDYIVKSNVELGLVVRKWITVSTMFSYNRFNRTGKENTLFTYGLKLDKYF